MNFSPAAIEAAAGYVSAVKLSLKPCDDLPVVSIARGANALRCRARAIAWGGLDSEELNALARIAGHPFAPDLPEWMAGGGA